MKVSTHFLLILFLATSIMNSLVAQWIHANGPTTNEIHFVATNANAVLVGTWSSGIYRSTDNCASWTNLLPVDSFMVGPVVSNGIFIGVRDSIIVRSTDDGTTWDNANAGLENLYARCLAANDSEIVAATNHGVYVSVDSGAHWIAKGLTAYPQALAVGGASQGRDAIEIIVVAGIDSVFRSTDNGKSWQSNVMICNGAPCEILSFIMSNSNLIGIPNAYPGSVAISFDRGIHWDMLAGLDLPQQVTCMTSAGGVVYAGLQAGVLRSSDDGVTWTIADTGLVAGVSSIAIRGNDVYAGTRATGILHSTDNGISWKLLNSGIGPPNSSITSVALHGADIFACVQDAGIFVSHDNGSAWAPLNVGQNTSYVSVVVCQDSFLFAGSMYNLYRSVDNGITWAATGSNSQEWNGVFTLNDTCILALATYGIFISKDHGTTWSPFAEAPGAPINVLAFCGGKLYAGTSSGVFRYDALPTRGGPVWAPVESGLTNTNITTLAGFDSIVFAGANALVTTRRAGEPTDVFRSTNMGQSWSSIRKEVGDSSVVSFAVRGRNVFAGTIGKGIVLSTDGGTSWKGVNNGLTDTIVSAIAFGASDIYLGTSGLINSVNRTYGHGVWRRPLSEMTSVAQVGSLAPVGYFLDQNFPNPFNPSTTIRYYLPSSVLVTLKVFDLLGREVRTLISQHENMGTHSITFDGGSLSSGVYFYRLQAGNYIDTKKFVLLK